MAETKICPHCGGEILAVAKKCKHCGNWLDNNGQNPEQKYIKCPICNEDIPADSSICPECGESLSTIVRVRSTAEAKELRRKIVIIALIPLMLYLAWLIFSGIRKPIAFNKEKDLRSEHAIQKLKDIRTLQVAYKNEYGKFAPTIDSLIIFYKNDNKFLSKDALLKREDFNIDSLGVIPFSGGKMIEMKSAVKQVSGVQVPLFEASIPYKDLLKGLDNELIENLIESVNYYRYPGLKVGSVDSPNNNAGNWE